ncbi:MAG TPA: GNAT family N-acetyltransferase [Roseiflexaceae bacterium]|nr:GNAT family N-acetyltransferase [Roseiflexaceae bacterium]
MTVTLRELTRDNWRACVALRVADDQQNFVASNLYSIAEAQFYPGILCRAVYAGETMVGFVMFGPDDEYSPADERPDAYVLVRLMIDQAHQGKGYGRAALETVMSTLQREAGARFLYLSAVPENVSALALYRSAGFLPTGAVVDGEVMLRLELPRDGVSV